MPLIDLFLAGGSINSGMPLVRINEENCYKALRAVERRFQRSKAPERLKRIARKINPLIFICGHRGSVLGQAYGVSLRSFDSSRLRFGLRESIHPSSKIKRRKYFMIIEINPLAFSKLRMTRWKYLCRVMGHEMGHILDFVVRQQASGSTTDNDPATDHDEFWQTLSKYYGGNTDPIISPS